MNENLLPVLYDCEHLADKLLSQMELQRDDAQDCMEGRMLAQYLTAYEEARARLLKIRQELVVLRAGVSSGL